MANQAPGASSSTVQSIKAISNVRAWVEALGLGALGFRGKGLGFRVRVFRV